MTEYELEMIRLNEKKISALGRIVQEISNVFLIIALFGVIAMCAAGWAFLG
jgi:hypothetical protein